MNELLTPGAQKVYLYIVLGCDLRTDPRVDCIRKCGLKAIGSANLRVYLFIAAWTHKFYASSTLDSVLRSDASPYTTTPHKPSSLTPLLMTRRSAS